MHRAMAKRGLIQRVTSLVPRLDFSSHKGQHGKIGIVGGSFEYTGAPFYAAHSALRTGCDLCHIFCTEEAAIPIKSYSPEVIVHPLIPSKRSQPAGESVDDYIDSSVTAFQEWLGKLDVLIIGPGLGREKYAMAFTEKILKVAIAESVACVLDADALFLAAQNPEALKGAKNFILTPNVVELARLNKALDISGDDRMGRLEELAARTKVTIFSKGDKDIVLNDTGYDEVATKGSPRRCGGQGDITAGTIGTFLAWAVRLAQRNPSVRSGEKKEQGDDQPKRPILSGETLRAVGSAGGILTRTAAEIAFAKLQRSTTTPDIIENIGEAFREAFNCQ